MPNSFNDQQVEGWLEDLNRLQRRVERALFAFATTAWIVAGACFAGVVYGVALRDGPLTTACGVFGSVFAGWGIALYKTARARRRRRQTRKRLVDRIRRQAPPTAPAA